MRLFVIRHGETDYNKKRVIQGNIDSQLTGLGSRQAGLLARELEDSELDMVFSSTASRAYETARPTALAHRLPVVQVPALRERDYGIYEKRGLSETKRAHPEFFSDSGPVGLDVKPEGGESLREVAGRVVPFVDRLVNRLEWENAAVVAHGVINKIIISHLLGTPLGEVGVYKQKNACINELACEKGNWRAVRLGYTGHLDSL